MISEHVVVKSYIFFLWEQKDWEREMLKWMSEGYTAETLREGKSLKDVIIALLWNKNKLIEHKVDFCFLKLN